MASKRSDSNIFSLALKLAFPLAVLFVFILVVCYLIAPGTIHNELGGPEQFGQFGDYIGGLLNAAFGFLTVFLLLVANKMEKKISDLSQMDYDRKQIEDALRFAYEQLEELVHNRIPVRVPIIGGLDYFTIKDAMDAIEQDGRDHMHELSDMREACTLPAQWNNHIGRTEGLMIQIVALTTDFVALSNKDSLKEFWVRRANIR